MGQGMEVEIQKNNCYFLNSEFSFNNTSIITIFSQEDLKTLPEGSVSQNIDLGPRYFLCYVEIFKIYFFTIFYVLWHKIKSRA